LRFHLKQHLGKIKHTLIQGIADKEDKKGTNTFPTCSPWLLSLHRSPTTPSSPKYASSKKTEPTQHDTLNSGQDHQTGYISEQTSDPSSAADGFLSPQGSSLSSIASDG
jgi:hypothetical protein